MTEEYDSRMADKFIVRMKPGQRDALKQRAKKDHQSMNDAAVTAIDKHLHRGEAFDELLRILERAIKPQTSAIVSIRRDYLQALVDAAGEQLAINSEPMVAATAVLGGAT